MLMVYDSYNLRDISCLILLLIPHATLACDLDHIDQKANVAWVYDGDTVTLSGGEKVRLIGINTPERGRDGAPDEPYAQQAKQMLEKLLATLGNIVLLRFDVSQTDRYERLLAHVYLPNGVSVSAYMLSHGLATALTVPPNDWNLKCYRNAEAQAQNKKIGIWSLPSYQKVNAAQLSGRERGFRIVEGTIIRVGKSQRSIWINLAGKFAIRIDRIDVPRFLFRDFASLKGQDVITRGWLYKRKGELRMRVRHPVDLKILSKPHGEQ
jgi:micrococcal nuclease